MAASSVCDVKNSLGIINPNNLPKNCATHDDVARILSILFITLGAFALLMVVIGAMRYIFAGSNAEDVTKARRMIIYSLIGLVIAAFATAIVNIVIGRLG